VDLRNRSSRNWLAGKFVEGLSHWRIGLALDKPMGDGGMKGWQTILQLAQ
jgi:hypothetical protein